MLVNGIDEEIAADLCQIKTDFDGTDKLRFVDYVETYINYWNLF